jgi:hypothetical protein
MAISPSAFLETTVVPQADHKPLVTIEKRCEQLELIAFSIHHVYWCATTEETLR